MTVHNVDITSRYDVPGEIAVMERFVGKLHPATQEQILSVSCDSKACATYKVEVVRVPTDRMMDEVSRAMMSVSDGHNGIYLNGPGCSQRVLHADWKQDR